ncbi:MAG: bacteriohemerythrin [Sideroxyarcus sp.]
MSEDNVSNDEVYFKWSPEYSVNIKTIDNQHQELVNMLNQLFIAVSMHEGSKVIGVILGALRSYTRTHFSLEERLMQQANYADLEAHKLEHLKLIGQLDDLCLRHLTEEKPIYFEMLRFLKTWLKEHIKGLDTKYSTALQQAGFSFATWEHEAAEEFNVMIEKTGRWWKIW